MHKRTAITIIVILLGVVVVIAALVSRQIRLQSPIVFLDEPQQVTTEDGEDAALRTKDPLAPIEELDTRTDREKVFDQYIDKVLAFDAECGVYPRTLTVPVRTVVLLNNRSSYERVIAVGSRNYVVAAQEYALATNNESGSYVVACDDHAQGKLEVVE